MADGCGPAWLGAAARGAPRSLCALAGGSAAAGRPLHGAAPRSAPRSGRPAPPGRPAPGALREDGGWGKAGAPRDGAPPQGAGEGASAEGSGALGAEGYPGVVAPGGLAARGAAVVAGWSHLFRPRRALRCEKLWLSLALLRQRELVSLGRLPGPTWGAPAGILCSQSHARHPSVALQAPQTVWWC